MRAGLDTLYGGGFPAAAAYFAELAGRDSTDPAPVTFEASAYIWWAAALENDAYEATRIDSLLDLAIARARTTAPGPAHDFWLATALGYRARQRDLHGHSWGAAKDGKAMRDAYARVLTVDSSCTDCYLGLGVYQYGLARASALARLVAKIVGLGSGNAERSARFDAASGARAGRPRRGGPARLALSRESGVPSILARDRPACALSSGDGGHPLLRSRHSTITAGKPYHVPDGTTRRCGISRPAMGSAAGRRKLSSAPWCVVPGGGFDAR